MGVSRPYREGEIKMLECESCGSTDYPYHKEYCDMGNVADWKDLKWKTKNIKQ